MITLNDLDAYIKAKGRVDVDVDGAGIRSVYIERAILQDGGRAKSWIDGVFSQLPSDAVVTDLDGHVLIRSSQRDGAYFGVMSHEWERLAPREDIPEFVPSTVVELPS